MDLGENGANEDELLIHNPNGTKPRLCYATAQMAYPAFPTPIGILRHLEGRETYEDSVVQQIQSSQVDGEGSFAGTANRKNSWVVE